MFAPSAAQLTATDLELGIEHFGSTGLLVILLMTYAVPVFICLMFLLPNWSQLFGRTARSEPYERRSGSSTSLGGPPPPVSRAA
jgi:hypothetical protein